MKKVLLLLKKNQTLKQQPNLAELDNRPIKDNTIQPVKTIQLDRNNSSGLLNRSKEPILPKKRPVDRQTHNQNSNSNFLNKPLPSQPFVQGLNKIEVESHQNTNLPARKQQNKPILNKNEPAIPPVSQNLTGNNERKQNEHKLH